VNPLLYGELTPWYRLLDPTEDHADEAETYGDALVAAVDGEARTLLELGSGAGNNAAFLRARFDCTLTDLSPAMLALSRALNPGCEHALGDMRDLRVGRTFDAVLCHDAVCYMATEADLRAAARTAFTHLRPGGAAVFAPDCVAEGFRDFSEHHEAAAGDRALGCLAWTWDPDPGDSRYTVDYAFLLRHGDEVRAVHDRHEEGLFSRADWARILSEVGFEVSEATRPLDDHDAASPYTDIFFVGRRPG